MKTVAGDEYDLLTVARAIVGEVSVGEVGPILLEGRRMPEKISPAAIELLQETLSKGVVLALCRRGGWRRRRGLVGSEVAEGRLWSRYAAPSLRFGAFSFELVHWLARSPLAAGPDKLKAPRAPTAADELLLYLAADLLTRIGLSLAQPAFAASPLCWLGFVGPLARAGAKVPKNFGRSLDEAGLVILDALQEDLTQRWVAVERSKGGLQQIDVMLALGEAQENVLTRFFEALDHVERRDLAGFLVEAAQILLERNPTTEQWTRSLDPQSSVADRSRAYRGAAGFLRAMARVAEWSEEHSQARFFDDEYDRAQFLLAQWEGLGEVGLGRVAALAHELESLHSLGTASETS